MHVNRMHTLFVTGFGGHLAKWASSDSAASASMTCLEVVVDSMQLGLQYPVTKNRTQPAVSRTFSWHGRATTSYFVFDP